MKEKPEQKPPPVLTFQVRSGGSYFVPAEEATPGSGLVLPHALGGNARPDPTIMAEEATDEPTEAEKTET